MALFTLEFIPRKAEQLLQSIKLQKQNVLKRLKPCLLFPQFKPFRSYVKGKQSISRKKHFNVNILRCFLKYSLKNRLKILTST